MSKNNIPANPIRKIGTVLNAKKQSKKETFEIEKFENLKHKSRDFFNKNEEWIYKKQKGFLRQTP